MITTRPTTQQLEEAREVIEWLVQWTRDTELYAENFISAGEEFLSAMPLDETEL